MNCRRAAKIIPLYAGGELSEKKARRLERHLEGCPDCRRKADDFRAVRTEFLAAAAREERDWPEAEWKRLMARIKALTPPRQALPLGMRLKPAWVYGAAVLLLLALPVISLGPRLFRPAAVPLTEILASTEVQRGRGLEFAESQIPHLRRDLPFQVREERARAVESKTLAADSAGVKDSQDIVSMTLVSQETGLRVHWTFNRHFDWKEEAKR